MLDDRTAGPASEQVFIRHENPRTWAAVIRGSRPGVFFCFRGRTDVHMIPTQHLAHSVQQRQKRRSRPQRVLTHPRRPRSRFRNSCGQQTGNGRKGKGLRRRSDRSHGVFVSDCCTREIWLSTINFNPAIYAGLIIRSKERTSFFISFFSAY